MRHFRKLAFGFLISSILFTACGKDGAIGSTIAAQVAGTFKSTNAKVIVDQETVVEASEDYVMNITEVDANTVSVMTDHTSAFEVDLSKNDNGDLTTGETNGGRAGFTFTYRVAEGRISVIYSNGSTILNYEGLKE